MKAFGFIMAAIGLLGAIGFVLTGHTFIAILFVVIELIGIRFLIGD